MKYMREKTSQEAFIRGHWNVVRVYFYTNCRGQVDDHLIVIQISC